MNWDAITAIAETAGVIGIIASLVFLGFQVKQNTVQLRQENLRRIVRGTLDTNWYFHRDDIAFDVFSRGCRSFDALSAKDSAHFHSILVDLSFYLELTRISSEAKLIDSTALEINERFFLAILITPGGKEWWEFAKKSKPMPDPGIAYLQSLIDIHGDKCQPITELQPWFADD